MYGRQSGLGKGDRSLGSWLSRIDGEDDGHRANDETRQGFVNAAQPAFEQHIANNLDAKATELLNLMKSELKAANSANYMQD